LDGGDSLDPKVDLNERINKNGKIYLQNLALTQTCSVDSKDNICFNPDVPLNAFKKDFFRDTVVTIDGVTYASGGAQTTEEEKEKVFKLELEDVKISYDINADDLEPLGA